MHLFLLNVVVFSCLVLGIINAVLELKIKMDFNQKFTNDIINTYKKKILTVKKESEHHI